MTVATPTTTIQNALDSALISIKKQNPNVPDALAVIISQKKGAHGTFTADAWKDSAGEHEGSARHQIALSPESFRLGADQVLTTLIHECGHALAHATGVQDTSRQGRFHNKKFRDIAEKMGLICTDDDKIGTRTPGMLEHAKAVYAADLEALTAALTTYKVPIDKPNAPKTTVRVACECGNPVTVTRKWYEEIMAPTITCTLCNGGYWPVE